MNKEKTHSVFAEIDVPQLCWVQYTRCVKFLSFLIDEREKFFLRKSLAKRTLECWMYGRLGSKNRRDLVVDFEYEGNHLSYTDRIDMIVSYQRARSNMYVSSLTASECRYPFDW